MQKKIVDGLVAVLYSPDFGAGWYTWHNIVELLFDPKVVDMVLEKTSAETIELYCKTVYGDHYYAGSCDLEVAWVPTGTEFIIEDFDGNESITFKDKVNWVTA
jgi:hypothetical protein